MLKRTISPRVIIDIYLMSEGQTTNTTEELSLDDELIIHQANLANAMDFRRSKLMNYGVVYEKSDRKDDETGSIYILNMLDALRVFSIGSRSALSPPFKRYRKGEAHWRRQT